MRLIDADALIAEYDRVHIGAPGGARKLMQDAPTVDAVEVVRCKDCRFYDSATLQCDHEFWMDVEGWAANAEQDGFCHKGERRDNGS